MNVPTEDADARRTASLVRALELANDLPRLPGDPAVPVDQRERATRDITARIRRTMAERAAPPQSAEPLLRGRAPVQWASLVALAATTGAVALFPSQAPLSIVLFVLFPVLLCSKWAREAYTGPELGTECDVVDQRALAVRRVRLRLDRLADVSVAAGGHDPTSSLGAFEAGLRSASAGARALAAHIARTSRVTRTFARDWFDDPLASCAGYRQESTAIRQEAAALVEDLREMVADFRSSPMAGIELEDDSASGAGDRGGPPTVGEELERIVDDLDRHRAALSDELTRLVYAFDRIHHAALLRTIDTRVARRPVRIAARISATASASMLRRERRTPARRIFLIESRIPRDTSLRRVRRAAAAMRTVNREAA